MRTSLTALAPLALAATLLTACGGASEADSAYCKDLDAQTAQFRALSSGDFAALDGAFESMHALADQAPDEVAEDWAIIDANITKITDALEKSGVTFADVEAMQAGGAAPKGVDITVMQELAVDLAGISGADMVAASTAIDRHAQEECGLTMAQG